MRSYRIELSGTEVRILRDTIQVLLSEETEDIKYIKDRIREIDKILFGAGP